MRNTQPPVKSLGSALRLLSFFTFDRPEWKVTELAVRTGMHKSQISRVLRTFEAHGFLQRNLQSGGYRIGRTFQTYAGLVRSDEELMRLARPVMEELNRITQGTVLLKVRDRGETVTIDRVESSHFLRLGFPLGHRVPVNASSSGKVFLAYMDWAEVQDLYRQGCFRRFTNKTRVDLPGLKREFAAIRRRGFAVSDEEHLLGASSVSAPIFNKARDLVAVLGIGLPVVLFPKRRIPELGAAIKKAAAAISIQLGFKATDKNDRKNLLLVR